MKYLLISLFLAILPPFCSCLPSNKISDEDYNNYDLILKGTVEEIVIEDQHRVICLNVDVMYKGKVRQHSVQVNTPKGPGMCGINAGTGDEWLIFANGKNGTYSTNICTRSKNLDPENHMYQFQKEKIAEDLAFLEQKLPLSRD